MILIQIRFLRKKIGTFFLPILFILPTAYGYLGASQDPLWFSSTATMEQITNELNRLGIDKIDIVENSKPGFTGLTHFVAQNRYEPFKLFLNYGARVNLRSNNDPGNTALHLACMSGNFVETQAVKVADHDVVAFVEDLIEAGADVMAKNRFGDIPLHSVSQISFYPIQLKVVGMLVKNGADLNAQNNEGFTYVHKLVSNYNTVMIRDYLLTSPWRIILNYQAKAVSRNIIRTPENMTPPCRMDASGSTANCPATFRNPSSFAQELGFEGASSVAPEFVLKQMAEKVDPIRMHLRAKTGTIPIGIIIKNSNKGNTEVIDGQKVLRPLVNLLNGKDELTLLMLAVMGRDEPFLHRVLFDNAVCTKPYIERATQDQYGYTVLHLAVLHGQSAMVKNLLERAKALNASLLEQRDKKGRTPFLKIPFVHNVTVQTTLLKIFADPSLKTNVQVLDAHKNNLLHLLVLFDNGPLLGKIASDSHLSALLKPLTAAKNDRNETPYDAAKRLHRESIAIALEKIAHSTTNNISSSKR